MRKIPLDVLDRLAAVPVFSGCSRKELEAIAGLGTPVEVEAGHVFTRQGVRGFEFFVVLEGAARCEIDGREVAQLGEGEVFGEMGQIDKQPATATVTARTPMRVLVLGSQEFGGMLAKAPSTADKLLKTLTARLRAAQTTTT